MSKILEEFLSAGKRCDIMSKKLTVFNALIIAVTDSYVMLDNNEDAYLIMLQDIEAVS